MANNSFDKRLTTYPGKVQLWAVIGSKEYELVNASFTFAMNMIPVGQISLAVGTDGQTLKSGNADEFLAVATKVQRTEISIYCKLTPTNEDSLPKSKKNYIPEGTYKVFEGYLAGQPGLSQSMSGQVVYTVGVFHWLWDLTFTSIIAGSMTPGIPENLLTPIAWNWDPAQAGKSVTSVLGIGAFLSNIEADVWKSISAILTRAAEGDVPPIPQLATIRMDNTKAKTALARFDKSGKIESGRLKFDAAVQDQIIQNIKAKIALEIFNPQNGGTAWDKILAIANMLDFKIIPTVQSATAAPHIGNTIGNGYVNINADEIAYKNLEPYSQVDLAGVVLFQVGGQRTQSQEIDPSQNQYGVIGSYLTTGAGKDPVSGLVAPMYAPFWLMQGATGVLTNNDTIGPGVDVSTSQKLKASAEPAKKKINTTVVGDKVAKYYFYEAQYRDRRGSISGRLRFDIGPGTSVTVENTGLDDKITTDRDFEKDVLSGYFCANVDAVIISFDAASAIAATSFQLSSIRLGCNGGFFGEQNGILKHPLYEDSWNGTYLINEKDNKER